jgi:response regulator RpfG family c-di-GMP phosphodiesterase
VSNKYEDSSDRKERRGKILFITGNKYESRILSIALENSGYDLIYISDRRNLFKVMSSLNEQPDLIIYMSDSKQIQPEDMIGIFHQLNIITPCLLITDNNQDSIEEKLLNSGIIKHHLIKPLSLKEMRNAIQIFLK